MRGRYQKNQRPLRNPVVAERSCESKVRYTSEDVARAVGIERQNDSAVPLFIYECPLCRGWHLTKRARPKELAVDFYLRETE
jgi:hypothetical protein